MNKNCPLWVFLKHLHVTSAQLGQETYGTYQGWGDTKLGHMNPIGLYLVYFG